MSAQTSRLSFDLNCDLGEGMDQDMGPDMGNDAEIMPYISSCNIACGGHAGDEQSMQEVVALAVLHDVKIGAHPAYPDKENFGRKPLSMSSDELVESLVAQTRALQSIVESHGVRLQHFKAHGALYNRACVDESIAQVIVETIETIDKNLILYTPYQSVLAELAAEHNISVMYEAFADRNYNDDLSLVSRDLESALITNADLIFQHVLNLLDNKVKTVSGQIEPIKADTLCVHGDTENAAHLIKELHAKCIANSIAIE